MQTRRYPRTLNEAFGPYTSRDFAPDPMPKSDKIVVGISLVGALCVVAFVIVGWV